MIRIIIADDHAIVRSGLAMLINSEQDMEVVGLAGDGREAYELCSKLKPQVVLMDLRMPPGEDGLVSTARIKAEWPEIQVLILTMHDDEEYLFQALKSGASGYILKTAPNCDLIQAIHTVNQGNAYLYPSAAKVLIEDFLKLAAKNEHKESLSLLTERERQLLKWVALGYSNKEISESLCISVKTVEAHKANIMEKLHLHSRPELVRYAMKKGLLDFE